MTEKSKIILSGIAKGAVTAALFGLFLYNALHDMIVIPSDFDNVAKTKELFGETSNSSAAISSEPRKSYIVININTADEDILCEIDGIGEVKARAIVEYRLEHGDFASVDELVNVNGIGEKLLEKIRYCITV